MSGGVDSSVSAYLLKKAGYNVVGVFIKTWTPDFIECSYKMDRLDAIRACAHLEIPFLDCDAEEVYKQGVADYMINEYKLGRTPNPDVMCNREVKFGVFWDFAKSLGADFIATGHYAKIKDGFLQKAKDTSKDQSYFLWTLQSDDLAHTMFPLGDLTKKEVREIARKIKLPNALKRDSQGVCFLGKLDMKKFLSHYINSNPGDVLNESGKIIGSHDGALFYTLGERHGFSVFEQHDGPLYVVNRNIENNTLVVSEKYDSTSYAKNEYPIIKSFLFDGTKPFFAEYRYHGDLMHVDISNEEDNLSVVFKEPVLIASGQSIVIYDSEHKIIGGGIVK